MTLTVALAAMAATAALGWPLGRALGPRAGHVLAAGPAVAAVSLAWGADDVLDGEPPRWSVSWIGEIGSEVAFRLDGLGLLFGLLVCAVGTLVLWWCPTYLSGHGRSPGRFYGWLSLFAAAMFGLVAADDVIVLYVCWELTTVASFLLIAHEGAAARDAAVRALLFTFAGGLCLLAGVLMLHSATGTLVVAEIVGAEVAGPAMTVGLGLVALAALVKSAQVPLHGWLPAAMVAPTPVSAYLHAAAMVKAGVYVLLRVSPLLEQVPPLRWAVVAAGLTSALVAGVLAFVRLDLKQILAYSTISQLGLLVALAGLATTAALVAAAVHVVAHGAFKSALFMMAGAVEHGAGTRRIDELGPVARRMPAAAAIAVLAALSLAGIPPLLGYVSKEKLLSSLLEEPGAVGPVLGGLAAAASALTVAYTARFVVDGFFSGRDRPGHRLGPGWLVPPAALAVAGLVLGVAPHLLDRLAGAAASAAGRRPAAAHLGLWHGLTAALGLSIAAVGGGLALFAAREPLGRRARRWFPTRSLLDGLVEGFLAGSRFLAAPLQRRSFVLHNALVVATAVVLTATVAAARGGVLGPRLRSPVVEEWVVVVLLSLACAGVTAVRDRLGAVAVLGVVEALVALWFVAAGAPDVVMTLLLVQTLSIALIVFVLRGMPRELPRPAPAWPAAAAAAVLVGVGAGAVAFLFTGRRPRSPVAEEYLQLAPREAHARNVVNAILSDFRALDTLGEVTVLALAATGVVTLLRWAR